MEGISDIRICGFDEKRPPRILKEPYINLFFKLIHQAPKDWCDDFNHLVSKGEYPVKINPASGLIIETWVRKPDEIANSLEKLKESVITCSQEYIAKIDAQLKASVDAEGTPDEDGEQGRLNKIVASLNFDD